MTERTEDEKFLISLKAVEAIAKEAGILWKGGYKRAAKMMLSYLESSNTDSLVSFHDFFTSFHEAEPK